ncbi:MAG: carboxypeptidase regulatory-like domain-containing protein [Rhodospirillales bacterium]|nr:carboxypeptidase regulatory-like domain-containing protein [Rhodospirillales bacterium]
MWWSILRNRFTITFGTIAIVATLWNIFVVLNDDGKFSGRVVDMRGRPVAGATVKLGKKSLVSIQFQGEEITDADGRFAFSGHAFYHVHVEARKEGMGISKSDHHLYFRGQNTALSEPLRLRPEPKG